MPSRLRLFFLLLCCLPALVAAQPGRDYVYMVGSSTIYPFATVVAERFGRNTAYRTPKVEATGSGGGFKLFCDGLGVDYPDITNASRRIKPTEMQLCLDNGVTDIVEVKVGYDGIVLAHAMQAPDFELTLRELYLALARELPRGDGGVLAPNPYRYWSDIHPRLPRQRIEIFGPPPTSGTRDELVEQAMQAGCRSVGGLEDLVERDPDAYRRACQTVREDGVYVEVGENDNLIVQKLLNNRGAFGIFGFNYLDQNLDRIKAIPIDGVTASYETIADRSYPISRPLFFYIKKAHVDVIPGLRAFVEELTSERAFSDDGYLADRGLVAMPADERAEVRDAVRSLVTIPVAAYRE